MSTKGLVCRACMQEHGENENRQDVDFHLLKSVFTELTLLHVADDDNLPKYICSMCSELLHQFKSFKSTCISSDFNLRKSLVNIKEEVVDSVALLSNLKVEPLCVFDDEIEDQTNDSVGKSGFKSESMSEEEDVDYKPTKKVTKSLGKQSGRVCDICDKSFVTANGLRRHRLEKHDTNPTKYTCTYCQRVLANNVTFQKHIKRHERENQPLVTKKRDYSCLICDKRFHKKNNLFTHCKEMHTVYTTTLGGKLSTCETCGAVCNTKREMMNHLQTHFGSPLLKFKCTVKGCRNRFKRQEDLDSHYRGHEAGVAPNVCEICFKSFATIDIKNRHRRNLHGTRNFKCKICNKILSTQASLLDHVKRHNTTPSRDFVCDICGQAFQNYTTLKVHKERHGEERNFKCDQCPGAYKTLCTLLCHKKKVHRKQACVCLICDQHFRSSENLDLHCRVNHTVYTTTDHLIFTCKVCNGNFKSQSTLKSHEKLHTGERPYACTLCPATFAHTTLLKRHSYTHTGEVPYRCDLCGRGFTQSYAMKIHKKTHEKLNFS